MADKILFAVFIIPFVCFIISSVAVMVLMWQNLSMRLQKAAIYNQGISTAFWR